MMKKPIKLNSLQQRTLALFQVLAGDPETSTLNAATGEVTISHFPHAHGNHLHIGDFAVSAQDASGFGNEAVWKALERRALIKSDFPRQVILTKEGLNFDTGLRDQFEHSDH